MWKLFAGRHAKRPQDATTLEDVYHLVRPLREHAGGIVSLLSSQSLTGIRTAQRVEYLAELVTEIRNTVRGHRVDQQCTVVNPFTGVPCALAVGHDAIGEFWTHVSADGRHRWNRPEEETA